MNALAAAQAEFLAAVLGASEPADPGLAAYRRSILGARSGALAAAHPVTQRLVGEAFFAEAARRYALSTPSSSGDLHAYGKDFADFLEAYPYAQGLPYLPDVARLEWAVHECSHASDGEGFDVASLAAVPPRDLESLRFTLHPAARLVASPHPVLAIWEANQADRDGTPARLEGGERVLVRREGRKVSPVCLGEPEWALLAAFSRGASLGDASASLEAAGQALAPALARVAALGALGGFVLEAPA